MTESGSYLTGISVFLVTAARGGTSPSYNASVDALKDWCRANDIPFDRRTAAEAPVDVARDLLAAEFLAATTADGKPYTHCVMVDAGIGFKVETIKQLLTSNEDFTSAAAPLRRTDIEKAAKTGRAGDATLFAVQLTARTRETGKLHIERKNGTAFAEIDGIGAALICLRRKVFERIFESHPELHHRGGFAYFQPANLNDNGESPATRMRQLIARALDTDSSMTDRDNILREALHHDHEEYEARGEDIAFSMRWRRLHTEDKPARVWVLCDAPLLHEGHSVFYGNFAEMIGA